MGKDLPVICYDMKNLVVGDARFVKCRKVLWKDIDLVESERIVQAQVINKTIDNSRTLEKSKQYTPMFGPKSKRNQQ
jgi:hypothetical protein